MFNALARLSNNRPGRVLLVTAVALVVAGVFGGPVAGMLSTGDDFSDPGAESSLTAERLQEATGEDSAPGVIALVKPATPEAVAPVKRAIAETPGVARTVTAYDAGGRPDRDTRGSPLVAKDGGSTVVLAFLEQADDADATEAVVTKLDGRDGVTVGGGEVAGQTVGDQVSADLATAELIAFPILFLLSLWVFRSFVAALLPLFVGMLTVFGTFLGLRLVNEVNVLSIYALNLAIALGLGLAIDYSLFVVSRYREEIERSGPGLEALKRTLQTAGRTVLFSSLTVAAAMLALVVFPQRFLYSMGIAGAITAVIAAAVALIALPAVLSLLGTRVNAGAPKRWKEANRRTAAAERSGFWYRLSGWVMRRPGPVAVVTALVLIVAGLPALGLQFTGVDATVLPEDSAPRQVDTALRAQYPAVGAEPIQVVVEADRGQGPEIRAYAQGLEGLTGVEQVAAPKYVGERTWSVDVTSRGRYLESETQDIVTDIRAGEAPAPVTVTGQAARFIDQQDALGDRLWLALAILAVTTLVILFGMTGSVLLPIKALIMNLLTLSAAFGLLVLIFQEGNFEGLLDYTSQGALESTQPLVLMALAFGLSTDYGVFLLTRIKEARDDGMSNDDAVRVGLERTGRIVTAAALLFTVAIGAFATSQIIFIKEVGIGTALAVLIDATLVRAFLVPALMKLLGEWNWWAPRPLRRLHERFGISEGEAAAA